MWSSIWKKGTGCIFDRVSNFCWANGAETYQRDGRNDHRCDCREHLCYSFSGFQIIQKLLEIPYCLMKGSHARSTIIYDKVCARTTACIDLVCCVLGIIVFVLIMSS